MRHFIMSHLCISSKLIEKYKKMINTLILILIHSIKILKIKNTP